MDRGGFEFGTGGAVCDAALLMLADRERAEASLVGRLAGMIVDGSFAADGAVSLGQWLRAKTGMSERDARRLVNPARLVTKAPCVAEALVSGAVRVGHVEALARVATPARQALFDRDVELLTGGASGLSVDEFGIVARRWAALADDELDHSDLDDVDREFFSIARTFFGAGHLSGFLSPESTDIVDAAITAAMDPPDPPDRPEGARTVGQRRADALVDAVGGQVTAQVRAVIDLDRLKPGDTSVPDSHAPFCDLDAAGPVDPETIRRLACTGSLARLVMDTPSRILDYGTSRRLFSTAQIDAMAVRDGGCIWPGCDRRPEHCDAHHEPAFPMGPTDLEHGMLLCRRHHRLRHEGRWQLSRAPDGTVNAISATGRIAGRSP